MSESLSPSDACPPLPYADADITRANRLAAILPGASIVIALFGFPLGAFTSIVLDTQRLVSHVAAERVGFMLFAVLEGLATACGLLGAIRMCGRNRRAYWMAVAGTVFGGAGSLIVLLMIAMKAIR